MDKHDKSKMSVTTFASLPARRNKTKKVPEEKYFIPVAERRRIEWLDWSKSSFYKELESFAESKRQLNNQAQAIQGKPALNRDVISSAEVGVLQGHGIPKEFFNDDDL